MSFRMHHSITLPSPFTTVWPLLSSAAHLARLQQALDGCKACTVTPANSDSSSARTPCPISAAQALALLDSTALPTPDQLVGADWLPFDASDTDAVRFDFMLSPFNTKVEGVQVVYCSSSPDGTSGDYGIVLFHSHVISAGIEERKMRFVEAVPGTNETRVSETVWGTAPRALAWTLKGTGVAAKTHRSHVDAYPKFVREAEAEKQGKA